MHVVKKLGRIFHWTLRLLLLLLVIDLIYLRLIWPDWKTLAKGDIPKSSFITAYQSKRLQNKNWPRLQWHPIPIAKIPLQVIRAVFVGEDSRFYTHSGFDIIAIREAFEYNWTQGRLALGASTISQQTVKNLFLSPARTPWRKWHELVLTWALEHHLSKRRILEIYLNTAEFGRGIYGVEAASENYWGTPINKVTVQQAAELAASLPGPKKNNPAHRTTFFVHHTHKIAAVLEHEFQMTSAPPLTGPPPQAELPPPEPADTPNDNAAPIVEPKPGAQAI